MTARRTPASATPGQIAARIAAAITIAIFVRLVFWVGGVDLDQRDPIAGISLLFSSLAGVAAFFCMGGVK